MKSTCIRRIVAMGDSFTWGYSVSKKEKCWVSVTTSLLEEFQGIKIELINQGVGSNVLTPRCPAYDYSSKPSAIERIENELICYKPDMVFLAFGLNDSRGGTDSEIFRSEYQKLINRILNKIKPVIVLVNTYYMLEEMYKNCLHWDKSSYQVTKIYNSIIEQLAQTNGLIYADVYESMYGADWIISQDNIHPNDLGHRIIGNKVFEAIVKSCSFTAPGIQQDELPFYEKYGNGPDKRE